MEIEITKNTRKEENKKEELAQEDKDLCKSMYTMLQEVDMRLKKLEEKLNRPLIG